MSDFALLLQQGAPPNLRQGVVASVAGGVCYVVVGTTEIRARYLTPAPSAGDTVLLTYLSNTPVVLGAFARKTATLIAEEEGEQDA